LKCIPSDYLMKLVERMLRVCKLSSMQRVATLKNLKYKIYFDLFVGYYIILHMLFHDFDVFTIILQCRKW
jgi:hypothetical protein